MAAAAAEVTGAYAVELRLHFLRYFGVRSLWEASSEDSEEDVK